MCLFSCLASQRVAPEAPASLGKAEAGPPAPWPAAPAFLQPEAQGCRPRPGRDAVHARPGAGCGGAGARPEAQWRGCTTSTGCGPRPGAGSTRGREAGRRPEAQGCGCTTCAGCGCTSGGGIRPGAGSTRGRDVGPRLGWDAGARPGVGCRLLKPCRGDCLCSEQSSLSKQILDHGRAGEKWKHSCLFHPYI